MSSYRDQPQYLSSSEDSSTKHSSSSSSDEETEAFLGVLSSPTSDYLIRSYLGEGTFGKVAKCLKVADNEIVAVKMIKYKKFTAEAQNEVEMLQLLNTFDSDKYNFIKFNDFFVDSGYYCFEFEILDISLWDYLCERPTISLTLKEIRPILYQMGITLEFLKSQGLVHSDLKPDNLMLVDHVNQPFKMKMIDFGLARYVADTSCGDYMQPRFYRAPEVILGSPINTAIDMWSLGCIAAELFLGHALYAGRCEYDMLRHMVRTQGQLPQKVLNSGTKTKHFFKKRKGRGRRWRLMSTSEYGPADISEIPLNSLDDLKKVRLIHHLSEEETMAKEEDLDNFVELLKKMLHLNVDKRITPSQLLEDPFITMNDLADNFPHSYYFKSCCEMMEVCKDKEVQSAQQAYLNQQPSTSTTSPMQYTSGQVSSAWHSHQEHPAILTTALAVSSRLSLQESPQPSQQPQTSFSQQTQLGQHTPMNSEEAPPATCGVTLGQKRKRADFEDSWTSYISPQNERKRIRMDHQTDTKRESPQSFDKPSTSTAEATTSRKDTEILTHCKRWKKTDQLDFTKDTTDDTSSPAKCTCPKKRKREILENEQDDDDELELKKKRGKRSHDTDETTTDLPNDTKEAPVEVTSNADKTKLSRKRTWATFTAADSGPKDPDTSSPEAKRMKMTLTYDQKDNLSSKTENKPTRKRTWATFTAADSGPKDPDTSSPEAKRTRMTLIPDLKDDPTSQTENRLKRTWDTFKASHSGPRGPETDSPERKKMKMDERPLRSL